MGQVRQKPLVVRDHGPDGHVDDEVLAALPMLLRPTAVPSPLGTEVDLVLEVAQRIHPAVGPQVHVTPSSPIATIRPATGHVFLAAEADDAIAPIARLHIDSGLINEATWVASHHLSSSTQRIRIPLYSTHGLYFS
jgi:hypothetical protein